MPAINVPQITNAMISAVKGVVGEGWPEVQAFAKAELKILAQSLAQIAVLRASDQITKSEAKSLLRQHKNTTVAVVAGIKGMSLLLAEQAVNKALKAVRDIINTSVGFPLI